MDKELRFESELNSIVEKAFEKSYNLHYRFRVSLKVEKVL